MIVVEEKERKRKRRRRRRGGGETRERSIKVQSCLNHKEVTRAVSQ
jgi:hypothetical protein